MRIPRLLVAFVLLGSAGCVGDLTLEIPGTDDGNGPPPNIFLDAGPGAPPPGTDAGAGVPPAVPDAGLPSVDECGDLRTVSTVHNGTSEPTYLPLTQGQIYAVGSFNGCSGLVVGDRWVLSARHCSFRVGSRFCVDRQARDPGICFTAVNVYNEPGGNDITLLEMNEDITARFPELEPVRLLTDDLDASWVGRTTEAGGFGQQEDGGFNQREFTANDISELERDRIVVNGGGASGVCYGDSGGPIMVLASDGTVRTAGVVSDGDGTCTYIATFTRVDLYRDWLEGHMGPTLPPGPQPCGDVSPVGACVDGAARYCGADGGLVTEMCDTCGWDDGAGGFRCLSGPDPCGGLSPRGRCEGAVARWCQRGVQKRRDCGACAQTCTVSAAVGATCQ